MLNNKAMRDIYYIVYEIGTLKIIHVSKFYNRETHNKLCTSPLSDERRAGVDYLNVTHPKRKELLAQINIVNGTDYN